MVVLSRCVVGLVSVSADTKVSSANVPRQMAVSLRRFKTGFDESHFHERR